MISQTARSLGHGLCSLVVPEVLIGERAAVEAQWSADPASRYCRRCGSTTGPGEATDTGCGHCRSIRLAWHGCFRLGAYRQPLASWILQMKFARIWSWSRWFGRQLAQVCAESQTGEERVLVTPIPLHWRRRFARGYDQAALIAESLAEATGWTCAPLLRRTRYTQTQSLIHNQADRLTNVRGAFAVAPVNLSGCRVILVDDVKTSGSTAAQCARLLRKAGAERVDLAVIAVADPRHADFQSV